MRDRILRIAHQHGYVANSAARNLRAGRTQTLSVVIPLAHESGQDLTDPFFACMLSHLADEITQRGYGMHLQKVLPPMRGWLQRLVAERRSDGIIVIGQSTEHATLEQAARTQMPFVVWGGDFGKQGYCVVGTDNVQGARLASEHLLKSGRRRIVFVGDPSIPEIKLPVIPSPTPGASEQVTKECTEALAAALKYISAINKCNKDLTAEYNALTVPKLHDFALKIGLSDTDVLDSSKVTAAIKAKCEADSAALKAEQDTAIAECKAAAANKESVCGGISKALAAQKKRRDELKAELAKVEAKIAANEKEKSDNGCQ